METNKKPNFKQKFTNFFGGLGYLGCAAQWLWVVLLYFSYIRGIISLMAPIATTEVVETLPVVQPINPLTFVIGSIAVISMVALTIFVFVKMPSTIAKTSEKFIHKSAESVTPILLRIQKKKETKRNRIKLTFGLILIIKISLIIIPVILSFMSQHIKNNTFDFYIAMYVSIFLFCISLIFFGVQYIAARLFSVNKQDIS